MSLLQLSRGIFISICSLQLLAMEDNVKITRGPQKIKEGGIPALVQFEPDSSNTIKTRNPLVVNEFKFKLIRLLHEPQCTRRVDKIDPETDFAFQVSMADKITRIAFDEPFHVAEVNGIPIKDYLSQCAAKSLSNLAPQLFHEETELTLRRTEFIDGTSIMRDILEQSKRMHSHNEKSDASTIKQSVNDDHENTTDLPQPSSESGIGLQISQPSGAQENKEIDMHQTPQQEYQHAHLQNHIVEVHNTALPADNSPTLRAADNNKRTIPARGIIWLRILPQSFAFVARLLTWFNPCYWFRIFRG